MSLESKKNANISNKVKDTQKIYIIKNLGYKILYIFCIRLFSLWPILFEI